MKNIIIILCIIIVFTLTGCDINNTPTSKVEEYLTKYQMLDIEIDINQLSNYININDNEKTKYKELIKKQYKNLVYEIKEETIDGNNATVKVEIEVLDYKKVIDREKNNILDKLSKTKEKITYTILFNITKDKKGKWNLESISKDDELKILGMK